MEEIRDLSFLLGRINWWRIYLTQKKDCKDKHNKNQNNHLLIFKSMKLASTSLVLLQQINQVQLAQISIPEIYNSARLIQLLLENF